MTEQTEAVASYRYTVSAEATERELRLCAFELLNHFLAMQHVLAEHLRLQPVEMLILLATTTANVQRALRNEALPVELRGGKQLPPGMAVPVSRRAIARITRLPTETVRRHVDSMIQRGILVSLPKGVHAPNRMNERWAFEATLQLIQSHVACTEKLIALQAISLQGQHSATAKRP